MKRGKADNTRLQVVEQSPVTYPAISDIRLRPGMAANAAARLLLLHLLEMMRANEAGILADTDIEFLHEYRIAVRRTRSALSQIRKVFPPEEVEYFKRGFQELGRRTNDLRNLDVFLATEPDYRARLPNNMREDITPLFDYLRSRRSGTLASVVAGLESKPYSCFLDKWNLFLRRSAGENSPGNALVPIIKLARGRIDRQYRKILRDGANALAQPEDKYLHALRIECKKLRYLLEFFAALFPPQEVAPLLKRLKRLQDNLGALSDLGDQRDYLFSIAEILDVDGARARRSLVATGYLMEVIDREQRSTRADFTDIFKDFSSPAYQKQFQRMIK
jgi:CHAD domain-containing protein